MVGVPQCCPLPLVSLDFSTTEDGQLPLPLKVKQCVGEGLYTHTLRGKFTQLHIYIAMANFPVDSQCVSHPTLDLFKGSDYQTVHENL